MADKKMKPFCCKDGHILGFIRWNGNDLAQLMVLREALDMDVEHPREVDLLGPLDGRMPIRCSICDDVKVWEISIETQLALFSRMSDQQVFEFSQRLLEMSRKVLDLDDPASTPIGFPREHRDNVATSPISRSEMGEEKTEVHDASV